jgi:hypothetical protein
VAPAAPPPPPPGPRSGSLTAAIFLYLGGTSVLGGIVSLLAANDVGRGAAAAVCGVSFVVLFFVAVALRPGVGMDGVRATVGVLSILFLVACFGLVVDIGDRQADTTTQLTRAGAAAVLFAVGMGLVGVLIPSAVAAGLSVLGVVGTAVLACAAAGTTPPGLLVAATVSAVLAVEAAFHVPRLVAHPATTVWMVNIAAPLVALPVTALALTLRGLPIVAAGLAGAALAVTASRRHAVVAAIVAAVSLSVVEGYIVVQLVGTDRVGLGLAELLIGLIVLVVVAIAGLRMRGRVRGARAASVPVEDVLLVATAVVALLALTDLGMLGGSFPGNPFPSPGGFGTTTPQPLPTFPPLPSFTPAT